MEELPQSGKKLEASQISGIDAPESLVKLIKKNNKKHALFICGLEEGE